MKIKNDPATKEVNDMKADTADLEQKTPAFPAAEPEKPKRSFVQRETSAPEGPKKDRLSFNLAEDGTIDAGSLKGKNRERIIQFMNDPRNREALGLAGQPEPQPAEAAFKFTEQDAKQALALLNGTNAWTTAFFMARFKNFPIHPQILNQAFTIPSAAEKELSERGARLMNRYSAEWMRKHADLVFFCAIYLDTVKTQALTAIVMQSNMNQQMEQGRSGQQANGGIAHTEAKMI